MFTPKQEWRVVSDDEKRQKLLECWELLDGPARRSLLDFAHYLSTRAPVPAMEVPTPCLEPRPEIESVVGAIKRLCRVYHMVDRRLVLGETTALMSSHVIDGRAKDEVIDELERVFEAHYRMLTDGR
jgi:hypothetical protein